MKPTFDLKIRFVCSITKTYSCPPDQYICTNTAPAKFAQYCQAMPCPNCGAGNASRIHKHDQIRTTCPDCDYLMVMTTEGKVLEAYAGISLQPNKRR